jgi:hypothetical protein
MKALKTVLISFALVGFFLLEACGEKKDVKPTIEDTKLVGILTDVRVLEGYYSVRYERVDSSKGKVAAYYNEVFAKHGVTKEQFESTMTYFASHPKEMQIIEEKVADSLSALVAEDRKKHFESSAAPKP